MFLSENTVEALRVKFPVGCRVVLDRMDDVQAPPIGTQGTCRGVDDAGSVMVAWDSGGSLSVAYGADSCHRVASEAEVKESLDHLGKARQTGTRCPRCKARLLRASATGTQPQGKHPDLQRLWNGGSDG